MSKQGLNLLVFREGRRRVSGPDLRLALMAQLEALGGLAPREKLIGALLRAGELECGVADADGAPAQSLAELTDCLAEALLSGSAVRIRSEEHTSELQSHSDLVCRLLLEKKKNKKR